MISSLAAANHRKNLLRAHATDDGAGAAPPAVGGGGFEFVLAGLSGSPSSCISSSHNFNRKATARTCNDKHIQNFRIARNSWDQK